MGILLKFLIQYGLRSYANIAIRLNYYLYTARKIIHIKIIFKTFVSMRNVFSIKNKWYYSF